MKKFLHGSEGETGESRNQRDNEIKLELMVPELRRIQARKD